MKKVDQYIDSVYRDFDGSGEEIQELKEEMRGHLLEMVEKLNAEGKSEKQAIQIAIARFGDKTQLSNGLMEFFEGQRLFAKKLLGFSIGVFVLGLIALSWVVFSSPDATQERKELSDNIAAQINKDSELSSEERSQIQNQISTFNSKLEIMHLSIYRNENGIDEAFPANIKDAEYVYLGMEPVNPELVVTYGNALNEKWFVQMQVDEQKNFFKYLVPFILFIVFGVLIIIWSFLNAYIKKYIKEAL